MDVDGEETLFVEHGEELADGRLATAGVSNEQDWFLVLKTFVNENG